MPNPILLARLRTERGMTQRDLADALGVVQGTVAAWESGLVRAPRARTARKLRVIFGRSAAELLKPEKTNGAAPKGDAVQNVNTTNPTTTRSPDA